MILEVKYGLLHCKQIAASRCSTEVQLDAGVVCFAALQWFSARQFINSQVGMGTHPQAPICLEPPLAY